jgi:hypothetical protein
MKHLLTATTKTNLPPHLYTQSGIAIGNASHRGITKTVTMPDSVRDRHVYIVGKSGTGKSTLIKQMARQDIERGAGVAVIDPHGDLVKDLLDYIPEHRVKDVIYFNAEDKEYPVALNMLQASTDEEVDLLADELLVTFKRLADVVGDKMEIVLSKTFQTLLQYPGATFLDIENFLLDASYRERIIKQVPDARLQRFWQLQFPNHKDAVGSILTRLDKFSRSKVLTAILNKPHSKLNFFEIIQSKKILLCNLSPTIGASSAQLLGSLMVSQLQLAVMRRASIPEHERHPFYLYVDEFQNFTTSAFEKIFSEARKYKLCLTIAHQFISQLNDQTRDAIFGNVGSVIMFGVGDKDAPALKYQLGMYEPQDVINLPKHTAFCRPETSARDTFNFTTSPLPPRPTPSFIQAIIDHTRRIYAGEQNQTTIAAPEMTAAAQAIPAPQLEKVETTRAIHAASRPLRATPQVFPTIQEKILYYVAQAEYLKTSQIIALCYEGDNENSKKAAVSRDLKKLLEAGKLNEKNFGAGKGSGKVYSIKKACNPTDHNLAVRDLWIKIIKSGYEIAEKKFFTDLETHQPDLAVTFQGESGQVIKTLWEYDAGTERNQELLSKVQRYRAYQGEYQIAFVFASTSRMNHFREKANVPYLVYAVLDEFTTLNDPAFLAEDQTTEQKRPYFY